MVFSSAIFLFLFLPAVLCVYFLIAQKFRNLFILIASLFFYAWGEQILVLLMMSSICLNYIIGILLSKCIAKEKGIAKFCLTVGISANISILIYYKYINFFIESFNNAGINFNINIPDITLPIGISFFTFQGISYLVDVFRKKVPVQKNLVNLGMYISMFPQLIAGPIVRYADISKKIIKRKITTPLFKEGITRFIIGLAKKVLIANNVGLIADKVFEIESGNLSTPLAWIGVLCYTLQIYYDFSGYSDMAIGLGKMFGFNFKENFAHPYASKSIREFWRRWHISLSTWFKDYLYIPLGGNRKGKYRTYTNLIIVFFLTGLWHGASWNFVIWGLYHGFFLIIERINTVKLSAKFSIFKRIYILLVVMIGWVLFRSENLFIAKKYLAAMFSFTKEGDNYPYLFLNSYVFMIIFTGIIFSFPIRKVIVQKMELLIKNMTIRNAVKDFLYVIIFIFSLMELANSTYNPFIYFRF